MTEIEMEKLNGYGSHFHTSWKSLKRWTHYKQTETARKKKQSNNEFSFRISSSQNVDKQYGNILDKSWKTKFFFLIFPKTV